MKKLRKRTPPGGMTYRQIARALGLRHQSVRAIEQRALRKLYYGLKPYLNPNDEF